MLPEKYWIQCRSTWYFPISQTYNGSIRFQAGGKNAGFCYATIYLAQHLKSLHTFFIEVQCGCTGAIPSRFHFHCSRTFLLIQMALYIQQTLSDHTIRFPLLLSTRTRCGKLAGTRFTDNHLSASWFNNSWRRIAWTCIHTTKTAKQQSINTKIGDSNFTQISYQSQSFRSGNCMCSTFSFCIPSEWPPLHIFFFFFASCMDLTPTDQGWEYAYTYLLGMAISFYSMQDGEHAREYPQPLGNLFFFFTEPTLFHKSSRRWLVHGSNLESLETIAEVHIATTAKEQYRTDTTTELEEHRTSVTHLCFGGDFIPTWNTRYMHTCIY